MYLDYCNTDYYNENIRLSVFKRLYVCLINQTQMKNSHIVYVYN